MRCHHTAVLVAALCGLLAPSSPAAPPEKITFQGRLTDADGNPINDTLQITFKLYNGASEIWSGTHPSVAVSGGGYSVMLGEINDSTALGDLDFDDAYTLGITVDGDAEMTPRLALGASPYAFRAKVADAVTDGVYTTGSYADPTWITSLSGSKIAGDIAGDAANVTGIVAIANGGTGSATQNFVDLSTNQTVAGNKTFSGNITFSGYVGSNVSATADNSRTLGTTLRRWQKGYFGPSSVHVIATDEETGGGGFHEWAFGAQVKDDLVPGSLRFRLEGGPPETVVSVTPAGIVGIGTEEPAPDPTDGAKLDVRGNIKLGNAGQLFASSGTENLLTLRGIVNAAGNPVRGIGFTSTRIAEGHYKVSFDAEYADVAVPAVSAFPGTSDNAPVAAVLTVIDTTAFEVQTFLGSIRVDNGFTFVVTGPR